jgi:hypothetical protein
MYLERTMDELERNLDNVNSYFVDLRDQVERELKDYNDEIAELKDEISTLEAQNILLEEQLEDLKKENAMFQLELAEITIHYLHHKGENEVFKSKLIHMQRELDLSRKRI